MNCLVVAATPLEIGPFLEQYRLRKGCLAGVTIDILLTGVGLTATTYSLTKQLQVKKPDLMLQAGIGGSFDRSVLPGSVFAIKQDRVADEGVVEKNRLRTLFDLKLAHPDQFPYSKGWLVNRGDLLARVKLKKVKAVSVNEITGSRQKAGMYAAAFRPVVESLEGAAFHYVALMEQIPFLQLRSISNYVGDRNKKNWKIREAVLNLNKELINLLDLV